MGKMDIRALAMGLTFALIWSSAFTSGRIIVAAAPPLTILVVRFALSGLIGVAIAAAMGQSARLTRGQWRAVIIFGTCQNALYLGLYFVAMQWIEASLAAIIASTMPLLVALAGRLFLGDTVRPLGAVGLAAGMVGVIIIMGARFGGGLDPLGVAFCVLGVLALTFATLVMRGASSGGNLMMIVGLQMLVGAAVLAPVALSLETFRVDWSWKFVAAFTYTLLAPGLLATWVWFALVNRIGALRAATFHFLNPFFGAAVAAVLLGERLTWLDGLGIVVIAAGILAVQISKQSRVRRTSM